MLVRSSAIGESFLIPDFIVDWFGGKFGPHGETILVLIVLAALVVSAMPTVLSVFNLLSPEARKRRRRAANVEMALKLSELQKAQREANLELVNVESEWRRLVADPDLQKQYRQDLDKSSVEDMLETSAFEAAERKTDEINQNSTINSTNQGIKIGSLSKTQRILLTIPSYLLLLPVGGSLAFLFASAFFEGGTGSGASGFLAVVCALAAFGVPPNSVEDLESSDLRDNLPLFKYHLFVFRKSVLNFVGIVVTFFFVTAIVLGASDPS